MARYQVLIWFVLLFVAALLLLLILRDATRYDRERGLNIPEVLPSPRSDADPAGEPRDAMARLVAWSTIANTVLTSLIGAAAAYVAYQAYLATQGQFVEARLANRPWITADPSAPAFPIAPMDGDSQVVRIRMTLRNIGHSPAQSALVSTELYYAPHYFGSNPAPVVARQRSVCNEAPGAGTQFLTLFPEQRKEQPLTFMLDESTARGPDSSLDVMLIGCVRYIDGNRTPHRTYFAYDLWQANKDGTPDTTGGYAIRLGKTKQVTLKAASEVDLFFAD